MPITKFRPNISQLLEKAVETRGKVERDTLEILERPVSIWLRDHSMTYSASSELSDSDSDSEDSQISTVHALSNRIYKAILNSVSPRTRASVYAALIKTSRLSKIILTNGWFSLFRVLLASAASVLVAYEVFL